MSDYSNKIRNVVFVALFASLISVFGFISIPIPGTPIPIVLQNMLVVLTALILGAGRGSLSVGLFLLLGLIGLPVFSGGGGGLARFLGPTGGFLYGYLVAAIVSGSIARFPQGDKKTSLVRLYIASFLGFIFLYVPGVIHFMIVLNKTFSQTMALAVLPYLPLDAVKACTAPLIAYPLRKTIISVLEPQNGTEETSINEPEQ